VKGTEKLKSRDVGVFDLCVEDYEAKTGGERFEGGKGGETRTRTGNQI